MPANPNLIVNGDFSAGNSGFASDFQYVPPDPKFHTIEGEYSIVSNPGTQFDNKYAKYGDHTSGEGKMLFVDGDDTGAFWRQSVSLAANTTYGFTYFVTAADKENLADITLSLNGTAVDAGFQITGEGGKRQWQQVTESFTTTSAGSYTLALSDLDGVHEGNDFTLDDLSLKRVVATRPPANNLLTNGDFSQGASGFSSDYGYVAPNPGFSTTVDEYSVITNPGADFANGYDSYGDHTSGEGKMLFVDGTNTGSFWRESVTLAARATYSFSFFVTGADGSNLPSLAFTLNGGAIEAGFQVSAAGGGSNWQLETYSFTTTTAGSYTLAMSDLDGVAEGNDFTLDDLSLVKEKPAPAGALPSLAADNFPTMVGAAIHGLTAALASFGADAALPGGSSSADFRGARLAPGAGYAMLMTRPVLS
jgi:hypothetical protein